jgi:hypothetical protein
MATSSPPSARSTITNDGNGLVSFTVISITMSLLINRRLFEGDAFISNAMLLAWATAGLNAWLLVRRPATYMRFRTPLMLWHRGYRILVLAISTVRHSWLAGITSICTAQRPELRSFLYVSVFIAVFSFTNAINFKLPHRLQVGTKREGCDADIGARHWTALPACRLLLRWLPAAAPLYLGQAPAAAPPAGRRGPPRTARRPQQPLRRPRTPPLPPPPAQVPFVCLKTCLDVALAAPRINCALSHPASTVRGLSAGACDATLQLLASLGALVHPISAADPREGICREPEAGLAFTLFLFLFLGGAISLCSSYWSEQGLKRRYLQLLGHRVRRLPGLLHKLGWLYVWAMVCSMAAQLLARSRLYSLDACDAYLRNSY